MPSKNTLFIAIYHPYWGKCKQHNLLSSILQSIIDLPQFVNHNVFVAGDVNDFRHELSHFASGNSLQQIVPFATRGRHTLDIILLPSKLFSCYKNVKKISPLGRSDHCVIFANPCTISKTVKSIMSRDFSPANHGIFKKILTEIDWKTLLISSECVNSIVDVFHNVLSHCFFARFPL